MRAPSQAWSGPSPDLITKQPNRDNESSGAENGCQPKPSPYGRDVNRARDTTGSAPLPPAGPSHALGERQLLTADDVALLLQVPRSLVYALVRCGELPAIRVGQRYVRFRAEALERWIESREALETQASASSPPKRRIAGTGGSPSTSHRGAPGTSLRRRANAPEPGIRRLDPDAS